ncbi:hypothetical protein SK128_028396 [Halocaridina rubra]|uniref:Ig-like domain-containing protein n=1 Tax=Halocaridina rubra TaxID=373956 RepID=A0AAN9AFJ4_HALRR
MEEEDKMQKLQPSGIILSHGIPVDSIITSSSSEDVMESEFWAQSLTLSTENPSDLHQENNTEVLAQVGGEATLSCFTHHLSDDMVTWLKRDNDQLLAVGQQVYAAEPRFTGTHSHQSKAWELWMKDVQLSDAGQYECQLTTHPPVTFFFTLRVTRK